METYYNMKRNRFPIIALLFYLLIISSCEVGKDPPTLLPENLLEGDGFFQLYDTALILNGADLDYGLTGLWEVVETTDIYALSDSSSPKCQFIGKLLGKYSLRWTVSNGQDEKHEDVEIEIIGFTDSRDNEQYRAVKIGSQIWMAENLRAIAYQNDELILDGSSIGDYSEDTEPKFWFAYNDNLSNVEIYGRLYTWHATVDSRDISPKGWHIPSDTEWNILQVSLGMSPENTSLVCEYGNDIAARLKEVGTEHWDSPNLGATDDYDFSALPAGYRSRINKTYAYKGEYACFWSDTEKDEEHAWYRHLYTDKISICRTYNLKNYGFSVRCIKD
jgi:uncharacterized protein (TIGR02145 family)